MIFGRHGSVRAEGEARGPDGVWIALAHARASASGVLLVGGSVPYVETKKEKVIPNTVETEGGTGGEKM